MAEYLNNVQLGDGYTNGGTLGGPGSDQYDTATILVSGNPAAMQFRVGRGSSARWTEEREYVAPAGSGTTNSFKVGNIRGVKLRNSIAGSPAVVSVSLFRTGVEYDSDDPVFEAGSLSPGTIQANGTVTPTTGITRVTALPGSPVDGQLVSYDLSSQGWTGVEWLCIYNASTGYWDVLAATPLVHVNAGAAVGMNGGWVVADSLNVPNQGDYYVEHGGGEWQSTNPNQIFFSAVGSGGAPAINTPEPRAESYTSGAVGALATVKARVNGFAANQAAQIFNDGPAGSSVGSTSMEVTPIRIK